MTDLHELGYGLIVLALVIAIPLGFKCWPLARRILGEDRLSQLRARAEDWATPVAELDPLADDLRMILRSERLRADIQRLRRIMATDMSMSATRQIGNRLAYDWLLRELEGMRSLSQRSFSEGAANDWSIPVRAVPTAGSMSGHYAQRAPTVEILDIRW